MATSPQSVSPFPPTQPLSRREPPREITPLVYACITGQLDHVKDIFKGYFARLDRPENTLHYFWPVLLTAIEYGYPEIVCYLLCLGIPLEPMHVRQAVETKSLPIFDVLIEHGWDINEPFDNLKPPALAFVVQDGELTSRLLDRGADPNAPCLLDLTPLSIAIRKASLETISLLFNRGGDIEKGQLAHHAVERKSDELKVLNLLDQRGVPLDEIQYLNHPYSWNLQCFTGLGTPLHRAAQLGKTEVVSYLLAKGADPSTRDSRGRTALDCARLSTNFDVVVILEGVST